jgi:hypothetical protein
MRAITTIAIAALSSPAAFAEEWYMGFGVGPGEARGYPLPVASSDGSLTSFSFSPLMGHDTMVTARLGARIHRNLAIEAGYFRLGGYKFDTLPVTGGAVRQFTARARSGGVALVGLLPVGQVDLYGRAGYARTEIKSDDALAMANPKFNDAYYGGGARWNITREAGLFAEYQRHDKLKLDGYFVGFDWRF